MDVKFLNDMAKVPTYGSKGAAGADLYAAISEPVTIQPGEVEKISTGIAIELPDFVVGLIVPRSGIATKRGLRLANNVGVIDPDYRGELIVALYNDSKEPQTVEPGERIAQLLCVSFYQMAYYVVDELGDTERGENGFGSTGTK